MSLNNLYLNHQRQVEDPLLFTGRSFISSFAVNVLVSSVNPLIGAAMAATAAVLETVTRPVFNSFFQINNDNFLCTQILRMATIFALCNAAGKAAFGIPFDVISTIMWSSLSYIFGINSYIYVV